MVLNNYHPDPQILLDVFLSFKKTKKGIEDKIANFELAKEVK